MFVSKNLAVNVKGNLTIGGIDTTELIQKYGTPLYVMDENLIRENCRLFMDSIEQYYNGKGMVCYASKAFSCKEVYRIMKDLGMGIDVVSIGELYTALSVDFPAEKICFHGNNKTDEELSYAIQNNVGRIIVDNHTEIKKLSRLAKEAEKKVKIHLRIKPGIDAHTHDFVRTGQIDSKFGFALETGEALEAARLAVREEFLKLKGIHCHIGSQIFDIAPFELAAKVMLEFIAEIQAETGCAVEELNLGGGFGIKYTQEDNPVPYIEYMERVAAVVDSVCKELKINKPFIIIEPGRSIVGPAGITLYTVGEKKAIPNIRTYVSVDGGMTDNPRYALYQSKYTAVLANKADQETNDLVTIAGKCCESGDLIGENVALQSAEPGDILAVLSTGAYNYSMASNYNRVTKPPVIMVKDGTSRVVVKRETLEDLVRNDL